LSKYSFRYEKTGLAKYISHLDFVRAINRALRRAHIPVKYSQGFNPHSLLSFGMPLPVGYTSVCEIFEAELERDMDENLIMEKLNSTLPDGIRILEVSKVCPDIKKIRYAKYIIKPEFMPGKDFVKSFLENDTIVIDKKTKSGIKEKDIKKDIREINLCGTFIEMVLSASNTANLKPDVVAAAFKKYGFDLGFCQYERVMFFDENLNKI